ncbi:hypothetical protein BOX15_Mlig005211g1, partial [Macrostomum lignano]
LSQAVNQLQFNLDHRASPSNLVTRLPANPQPLLIEKRIDPRRMELMGRLARRELQHSRERLDAGLPPGPKNVERRLRQSRAVVSRKTAEQQQQQRQQRQQLPSRSHSPPVRDTDRAWRPNPTGAGAASSRHPRENAASMKRHEALELRRLREEVQQYATRMAELEAERLLGRGSTGGAAKRRPGALPFPTRPRSARVAPSAVSQQQQQQRQPSSRYRPPTTAVPSAPAPARTAAVVADQPATSSGQVAAAAASSDSERSRIVAEVLAAVKRELGLRGGGGGRAGGGFVPSATPALSASAGSLIRGSIAGSLAELCNIDHRLSQLETEGDDIRDRWAAALAAGDEPICSVDGRWQAGPPDPLRFVKTGGSRRPAAAAELGESSGLGGSRQPAVLQLTPAEVQSIRSQRDRYRDFLTTAAAADPSSGGAAFRPTQLTDAIAEQLLDEMLTDAAGELLTASDAIVGHLVASETGVGGAEAAAAMARRRYSQEEPAGESYTREAVGDYYYDEDEEAAAESYGSPEFESEHSSDED